MRYLIAALLLWGSQATAQCICLTCINPNLISLQATAGSMEPALPAGSCFTARRTDDPASIPVGTIITFEHPASGRMFIKRLIAIENQTVQMIDGQLWIDGTQILQTPLPPYVRAMEMFKGSMPRCGNGSVSIGADCITDQFSETLGNNSYSVLDLGDFSLDNTGMFTVPTGHVFVLGDNRDNSTDSRIPQAARGVGFVPVANIIGVVTP